MAWSWKNLFGFGGDESKNSGDGGNLLGTYEDLISKYSYMPQYTAQTEKGLYDLFNQTTGLGGGGVEAIPFDIGLPTTGLYDALTRGIKQDYLGTEGGPEGGRIADLRAYYNNLGVPEQAMNQERLANQDLNNSLTDTAAELNNVQKDRLLNVLGLGANVGGNLYGQNLQQHRFNTGLAAQGASQDAALQDSIMRANNDSLNSLLGSAAYIGGSYYGGPVGGAAASTATNSLLGGNQNAPLKIGQTSSYDPYTGQPLTRNNTNSAKLI